jgi:alpha-ketoglutarate-dependent taurine dioxygenase
MKKYGEGWLGLQMTIVADQISEQLSSNGYAFGDTSRILDFADSHLGSRRPGGLLTPKTQNSSEGTHSGIFGLGEFPWHTDGAVSDNPPRWMILTCLRDKSNANTELYSPKEQELEVLRDLVLRSQNSLGQVRYLPAVSKRRGVPLVRWDPRACPPTDPVSADLFSESVADVSITWIEGASLIVDNYRYLHRRTRVIGGQERLLQRDYIY